MKYYYNGTANVTTKHESSIEEYQLNVDICNENVIIEVFQGNILIDSIDENYGSNKKPEWRQDYTHTHYVKSLKKYLKPHQHNFSYNLRGQSTGEYVSPVNKY